MTHEIDKQIKLKEEYLRLCKQFQQLKQLARINLDLLFLSIGVKNDPEIKKELDKVQELVQALNNEEEVYDFGIDNVGQRLLIENSQISSKENLSSGGRDEHDKECKNESNTNEYNSYQNDVPMTSIKSLDQQLVELTCAFTEHEVIDAFSRLLEQTSNRAFTPVKVESTQNDEYYLTSQDLKEPNNENKVVHSIHLEGIKTSVDDESRWSRRDVSDTSINQEELCEENGVDNMRSISKNSYLNYEKRRTRKRQVFTPGQHVNSECGKASKSDPVPRNQNLLEMNANKNDSASKTGKGDSKTQTCTCTLCGKELKNKNSLQRHLYRHKGDGKLRAKSFNVGEENESVDLSLKGSSSVNDNNCGTLNNSIETEQHLETHKDSEVWTCIVCGKILINKYSLQRHLLLHKENGKAKQMYLDAFGENTTYNLFFEGRISCDKCGMSLTTKKELRQHMKAHKNESQTCTLCRKELKNKKSLDIHLRLHKEKDKKELVKCSVCDKEFQVKSNLRNHMRLHSEEKPFMCDVCGKAFKLENSLKIHKSSVHLKITKVCEICGKGFSTNGNLRRHRILHRLVKPYKCSLCDKAYNSSDARNAHMRTHTGNYPHYCLICGKGFNAPKYLREHERIHSGLRERPFVCCVCGKSFLSQSLAKAHEEFQSPAGTHICSIENFHCSVCKREFRFSTVFALHLLSNHGEELDHCPLCKNNEAFNSSEYFKSHLSSVHLKEKPFECSICGGKFYTYYRLLAHRATHKGKMVFKCSDCGKLYSTKMSLKTHQLSKHSSVTHRCDICGKEFNRDSNMLRHRRIHSGVKEYKCSVCGRNFATNDALKLHAWTHRSDKKFQCSKCDRGFNDKRNLLSHTKRSHPDIH